MPHSLKGPELPPFPIQMFLLCLFRLALFASTSFSLIWTCSELHLSATWPCVTEDVLVDSDVYSDLDPGSAPLWTARLVTATSPPCLLSEYLTEFLHVCRNNQSISQILGPDYTQDVDGGNKAFFLYRLLLYWGKAYPLHLSHCNKRCICHSQYIWICILIYQLRIM